MRTILKYIITAMLLCSGALLFPDRIYYQDNRQILSAIIVTAIVKVIIFMVVFILSLSDSIFYLIACLIIVVITPILQFSIANTVVSGFEINGISTYIILAILQLIFNFYLCKKYVKEEI